MASVSKQSDDTFVLALSPLEQRTLRRRAGEHGVSAAQYLDALLTRECQNWMTAYRNLDLPTLRERYEAADVAVQTQVDTLLGWTP